MRNKSYIQTQIDFIQSKSRLENDINNILEKYSVKDTVFGLVNGNTKEIDNGYMVESKRFNTLNEAIREMQPNQVLRIVEDNTFIIGDVYASLNECQDKEHVFNIKFLEEIY